MKIKIQSICNSVIRIVAVNFFCIASLCTIGCSEPDSKTAELSQEKKLPKMKFHRPKTMLAATDRLYALCQALRSDDPIPAPSKFTVIEVIHGKGAGAHSHYHLSTAGNSSDSDDHEEHVPDEKHGDHEDDGDHKHEEHSDHEDHEDDEEHEDDDGHVKTGELTHEIEVDAFTELSDVIRWLPKIAAADGLAEADWMAVNEKVQSLKGELLGELDGADSDVDKRTVFKKHADSVDQLIKLIRPLAQKSAGAKPKDGDSN